MPSPRPTSPAEACIAEFKAGLEKGQVPSKDILKTVFAIDFIYEGFRYKFTATRSSLDSYHLFINGSRCSVGVRALSDGGLLVLLDGRSHNVYWKDEVGATRLSVDSKTCLLEQENDPTQLRTPSPGKLVKYTVDNGAHVKAGQTFAEVEVMKMYMPLVTQEDGVVQLIKQPGATLEAGDILGILALDDPSRVKQAQPFIGQLPSYGESVVVGTKPTQRFIVLHTTLMNILQGYDNSIIMLPTLKELIEVLRDPELPYSEWNAQFSALHARMPQKLDAQFTQIVDRAKSRQVDFPAKYLGKAFQKFLDDNVAPGDAGILKSTLSPLTQVLDVYAEGQKVRELNVMKGLLEVYWDVERLFTSRGQQEDAVVLKLRDQHKDDISKVVQMVLSHSRVAGKSALVLAILDEYKPNKPNVGNVAKYLRDTLRALTELQSSRQTSKVSLKAREIMIQCSLPSLEERTAQMEHILRSSVVESRYGETGWDHREPSFDVIKEVVDSKYTVFDVLTLFFAHEDPWVSLAALEVYVRRAYRAYILKTIEYHKDELEMPQFVTWGLCPSARSATPSSGCPCSRRLRRRRRPPAASSLSSASTPSATCRTSRRSGRRSPTARVSLFPASTSTTPRSFFRRRWRRLRCRARRNAARVSFQTSPASGDPRPRSRRSRKNCPRLSTLPFATPKAETTRRTWP